MSGPTPMFATGLVCIWCTQALGPRARMSGPTRRVHVADARFPGWRAEVVDQWAPLDRAPRWPGHGTHGYGTPGTEPDRLTRSGVEPYHLRAPRDLLRYGSARRRSSIGRRSEERRVGK